LRGKKKGFFMKLLLAVLGLFAAFSVYSQSTPAEEVMESQMTRYFKGRPGHDLFIADALKPNEIRTDGVTYSGILVELSKTDDPLQLFNPLAPAEYGSSEDNVARDPITGKVSGLKLFAISF
jgi:hypothetical protein